LSSCHREQNHAKRLKCCDRISGYVDPAASTQEMRPTGLLAERWGYNTNAAETRYQVSQHDRNYVALNYTGHRNAEPHSPTHAGSGGYPSDLNPLELGFQLRAKARIVDFGTNNSDRYDAKDHNFGIWLAYTQQSFWQIFNAPQSRPFRETDYQPEVIFALRPEVFIDPPSFDGVAWRLLNFGLVHQSNGQSDPLSRSWNRVYAQLGFDKQASDGSDRALLPRPWYRFKELREGRQSRYRALSRLRRPPRAVPERRLRSFIRRAAIRAPGKAPARSTSRFRSAGKPPRQAIR
jgi:phospholipase A1